MGHLSHFLAARLREKRSLTSSPLIGRLPRVVPDLQAGTHDIRWFYQGHASRLRYGSRRGEAVHLDIR